MYKNIPEAVELANGIKRELYNVENLDIVLCPAFTALSAVCEIIADSNISLGAQDIFWEAEGAFTGEVSPRMLKDAGCGFVIIGHSERRQHFSETNLSVNKKIRAAQLAGLTPIVCVGETLQQRQAEKTMAVIKEQIEEGLGGISLEQGQRLVVAYEPVWAIGTGQNATSAQAEEVHKYIRSLLAKMFGGPLAEAMRIQYGGSVKPENIKELIEQPDIDGALIGGASLSIDSFSRIVRICQEVRK